MKARIFAVIWIIFGLIFGFLMLKGNQQILDYTYNGGSVEAEITDSKIYTSWENGARGMRRRHISELITFSDLSVKYTVDGADYTNFVTRLEGRYHPGEKLTVYYLNDNPSGMILTSLEKPPVWIIVLFTVMPIAIGIFLLLLMGPNSVSVTAWKIFKYVMPMVFMGFATLFLLLYQGAVDTDEKYDTANDVVKGKVVKSYIYEEDERAKSIMDVGLEVDVPGYPNTASEGNHLISDIRVEYVVDGVTYYHMFKGIIGNAPEGGNIDVYYLKDNPGVSPRLFVDKNIRSSASFSLIFVIAFGLAGIFLLIKFAVSDIKSIGYEY